MLLGNCVNCSCNGTHSWSQLCADQWTVPTREQVALAANRSYYAASVRADDAYHNNVTLLYNTAGGWVLSLKQADCWLETFAGLTMLASHLVIWYYAPERSAGLVQELDEIQDPSYFEMPRDQDILPVTRSQLQQISMQGVQDGLVFESG